MVCCRLQIGCTRHRAEGQVSVSPAAPRNVTLNAQLTGCLQAARCVDSYLPWIISSYSLLKEGVTSTLVQVVGHLWHFSTTAVDVTYYGQFKYRAH
jgi:hypothetical protein